MPNLVVCELSTTNLNHHYGYKSIQHNKYLKKIFPEEFTYNDYNYITIDFIKYVNNYEDNIDITLNQMVDEYIKVLHINETLKATLKDNLLSSGYSIEDIKHMY